VTPSRHVYALLWAAKLARARGEHSAAVRLIDEAEDLLSAFEDPVAANSGRWRRVWRSGMRRAEWWRVFERPWRETPDEPGESPNRPGPTAVRNG